MVGHVFEISWLELIIALFYVRAIFRSSIMHKVYVLQEKKFLNPKFYTLLKIIWISLFNSGKTRPDEPSDYAQVTL